MKLYELIYKNCDIYKKYLIDFVDLSSQFMRIGDYKMFDSERNFRNEYLPILDAFVQYSFLKLNNPKHYFEIGSGESTKFARKAISDFRLRTKITSIDPCPRLNIDSICDVIVREPLEEVDLRMFQKLEYGDILFVDSSHRVFQNSDVTVCFLDIVPYLKPGVFVHFHDILYFICNIDAAFLVTKIQ